MCVTSPDQTYTVERYAPADRARVLFILEQVWGVATQQRMATTWDWKYNQSPHHTPAGHQSLVIKHKGEPVGFLGYQAARMQVAQRPIQLAWGSELSILPEHRGQGHLVMRHIAEKENLTVMGNAGNQAIHNLQTRFGAFEVTRWVNCKLITRGGPYLRTRRLPGPVALGIGLGVDLVTRGFRACAPRPNLTLREISRCDERFDTLWEKVSRSGLALTVRDRAFLDWRFTRCPNRSYTILGAYDQETLRGYVVVRSEDMGLARKGLIVDILASREDHSCWLELVLGATEFLANQGASLVSCTVAASYRPLLATLRRAGFLLRTQGIPLTAHVGKGADQAVLARVLHNPHELFLTRADTDLDFNT